MAEKCFYDISNVKTQDSVEYPETFAKFYDVIYDKLRSSVDYDYYLKRILECKGTVLEVGVGTGRIFKEALNKGADIYGIDVSKTMIDVLRSNIPEENHNRVFVKDARDFNLGVKFDLIVMPFRTFSHFIDTDDQLKVLNNIHHHLNPEGRLIFDVFNPDLSLMKEGLENLTDFEGEYESGRMVKRIISMKTDFAHQIMNSKFVFEWDENNKINRSVWDSQLRYFFRYELENLVRLSKLRLIDIYGDFREGNVTNISKDFVVVCRNDILKR
ncbi:MAG: class I SAM-dependent methyltransferase [Ignavibacteriota bacterium]